jgi:hypothetical protein
MAVVLVKYDTDGVAIVTGDIPPDPNTPIAEPVDTGHVTNQPFIVAASMYCYGLAAPCTPLWQVVQAIDDVPAEITFTRAP